MSIELTIKMRSKFIFYFWLNFLIKLAFVEAYFVYSDTGNNIEKIYSKINSTVTLPCIPHFKERSINTLSWYKEENKILDIKNDNTVFSQFDQRISLNRDSSSLIIKNIQYYDTAEYHCEINGQNSRAGYLKLFVQGPPDVPGRPLLGSFSSRSVNLSWIPSKDNHFSPIIHYIIQLRNENEDWDSSRAIVTPDNRTSFQITGLQPFTVYSFRIIAKNGIGLSIPSESSFNMITLRELPEGLPTITYCGNFNSSNSIKLSWLPPPNSTLHGELVGYKITYRPRDNPEKETEISLENSSLQEYTIKNLETYTQYIISLQVFNLEGKGPAKLITAMTDEGIPSPPVNVTIIRVGQNDIKLNWYSPEKLNGKISGYYIHFDEEKENKSNYEQIYTNSSLVNFEINNLKPFTLYKVWIEGFNSRHRGNASQILAIRTDTGNPSPPIILNMTCYLSELTVQWQQPKGNFDKIDTFEIFYKQEEEDKFNFFLLNNKNNYTNDKINDNAIHEFSIKNLTQFKLYEIKLMSKTRSHIEDITYNSSFSESRKVFLNNNCRSYLVSPSTDNLSIADGITIGVLCASFLLVLLVLSLLIWKKYFQAAYYYLDDPPNSTITRGSTPRITDTYDEELGEGDFSGENKSVLVSLWPKHVQNLHADGDIGFSKEYEAIQASVKDVYLSCEHSQMIENKAKNRYLNIVAYDHSRVMLKTQGLAKKSADYINANYISGYCKPRAYIGTQGPLPSTFEDYWLSIWQQRVYIIVMITNLIERGRRKCDMYWPREGTETYGNIQVKLLQEVVMATYTLRTFNVKNLKIKKKNCAERTVYQYHYTNWPDHGVPDHPLPVLSFIRKSSAANPMNGGPIVVHCSAGVGRTGTYIVIDAMLKQIKHRNTVNVYGFLKHIRKQRNYLVQTEEQYIFIHDALLEAIESGDTEIPSSHLSKYIQTLQNGSDSISYTDSDYKNYEFNHTYWPLLERQYKMVTNFRPKDFNVESALSQCNRGKNRSLNLIPLEQHRVHITPSTPGQEGLNYINATFLPGFTQLNEFIITQHPLLDTIQDFWICVWCQNVNIVVMLSNVLDEKNFPQFWPNKDHEVDYGSFKVRLIEETCLVQESGNMITTRDFILMSNQDDFELNCRIVHCPGWPETCGPLSNVFDLVKMIQNWNADNQTSPIIVMDKYGGTEAATFCCLTTLYKQLNFEDCVDVYMYAKLYHLRRPAIWRSQDDYLFLYRAAECMVSQMNIGDLVENSSYDSQMNINSHMSSNGHLLLRSDQSIKSESIS